MKDKNTNLLFNTSIQHAVTSLVGITTISLSHNRSVLNVQSIQLFFLLESRPLPYSPNSLNFCPPLTNFLNEGLQLLEFCMSNIKINTIIFSISNYMRDVKIPESTLVI